jgi:hypothetical protein
MTEYLPHAICEQPNEKGKIMSVVAVTLTSNDDATMHVGLQVDFGASAWQVTSDPKKVPLLGSSGQVGSLSVAGTPTTMLYLADGATPVIQLSLFGDAVAKGDNGTGHVFAKDATDSFDVSWNVDAVT